MIKVLDQHTIDKIAAGEVIERPSSIVKELVENSIDSGATRITVEVTDGGTSMIRVTDNGSGIEADDVRKAYMSHATSKLDNVDDLMNIVSLGFRGEALSTIAAISQVEMITKTRDSMTGIKYEIHGGKEIEFKEIGAPDGTTIISRNIFYNTPARLKFLKSNVTEASYINDLMTHIALSNPDISIKLISNNKTIIDTQGDGRLRETIYSLYGKDITRGLLEVDYKDETVRITGFIGKPFLSKGNRSFENYFVNKRYVKSAIVNRAIEEAYKTHIMQHKFPYTALFIELPTYMVDVNVHPAKREFRFDDEQGLFRAVFHAVKDALTDKEMIPDAVPFKESVSNSEAVMPQTGVSQLLSSVNKTAEDSLNTQNDNTIRENIVSDNTSSKSDYTSDETSNKHFFEEKSNYQSSSTASSAKDRVGITSSKSGGASFSILESLLPQEYRDKLNNLNNVDNNDNSDSLSGSSSKERTIDETISKPLPKDSYQQEEMSETRYLSEEAKGHHKIIGQVFKTYWITEYDGTMYLMDQHAAHEKVNYETFLEEFKNRKILSQNLFPPEMISLTNKEKVAVLENVDYLKQYGFEIEDFGANDIKLSAMPANLIGLDGREVFNELVAYLSDGVENVTEDIFVRKLATMGCKAAIKGNQEITEYEVRDLIEKLMKLKDPYTCPHGRPTLVKFTQTDLDKMFKRIVD
ncbi:MAG: DNA mismatch repair endonuclease MutL [Eubacterium sp.]|nr:DNA mismatch repair endonuclease MutL [Eubacterium sp.]